MVNPSITRELLVSLVEIATRAPSSHNSQPWKFKIELVTIDEGDKVKHAVIRLFADGSRRLKLTDLDGRELVISCGAALMNLRVAAEANGFATRIEACEVKNVLVNEEFELAKLFVEPTEHAEHGPYAALFEQISRRVTYRKPFKDDDIPAEILSEVTSALESEGAWLHVVSNDQNVKRSVSDMIQDANDVQWQSQAWRDELANWIRPSSAGDGLHIGPDIFNPIVRFFVRWFKSTGDSQGQADRHLALTAPILAVVGVDENNPKAWLNAGLGLQRALLVAAKYDIFISFFNQPLQVKEFAGLRFAETTHRATGYPCLLLRMGWVENPEKVRQSKSSRRPVSDVIIM